ncbi:MAG: YkgJ family cysteine cluster protein [Myxococcales bacterium]|nr:YkgJ family cysteine cluster protein [Myxococcales bacterium]
MLPRAITHCYRDPLSEVWIAAAHKVGLKVQRTSDAFAHSDGAGSLYIATDEHLDEDDCLAQMIFHEICHSLVEGPCAFQTPDWGLDNRHDEHRFREHAALRVQAVLTGRFGLRNVLAPTTDFRSFYDDLGPCPLSGEFGESTMLAKVALRRAETTPWWPHLGRALEATASIVKIASKWAAPSQSPALYRRREEPLPPHVSGLPARSSDFAETCGDCTWLGSSGHCQQAGRDLSAEERACERFEAAFDCLDCGACCRAAYHSVTIAEGDVVEKRHPRLMVHHENYTELRREGDHCAALESSDGRHSCSIYEDRPTCCREFKNAGTHCVTARRRLGLSL